MVEPFALSYVLRCCFDPPLGDRKRLWAPPTSSTPQMGPIERGWPLDNHSSFSFFSPHGPSDGAVFFQWLTHAESD